MQIYGPERRGAQGLSPAQWESGNRAILALLEDRDVRDHVDLVITCLPLVVEDTEVTNFLERCGQPAFDFADILKDFLDYIQHSPDYDTVIIRASLEKRDGMSISYKIK